MKKVDPKSFVACQRCGKKRQVYRGKNTERKAAPFCQSCVGAVRVPCPECGKGYSAYGMWQHRLRIHGVPTKEQT